MDNEKKQRVVITYGTFDLFHRGHFNILKRARELGDYLIVGVTGDTYDAERGKLSVRDSLPVRIENVSKTGFADRIIVEEYFGQKIQDILKYDVDVLVVGSDWKGKFDHMRKYCEVVYLERTKDISSTELRETSGDILKLGIVTDEVDDDNMVLESKFVSGIHVESVFAPSEEIATEFRDRFELDSSFTDYEAFLQSVDIVYIRCSRDTKADKIKKALEAGKIVLSSPMLGKNTEEIEQVYNCAEEGKQILLEAVSTFYLQSFLQLLWNAKGNLIGDIIMVENEITLGDLTGIAESDMEAHLYFSTLIAKKMIGNDLELKKNQIIPEEGSPFVLLTGQTENGIYMSKIGSRENIASGLKIIGTKGTIFVPDDWWKIGYFELTENGSSSPKRYSCNYEGNGLRYVLVALLNRIHQKSLTDLRLTKEEVIASVRTTQELCKE